MAEEKKPAEAPKEVKVTKEKKKKGPVFWLAAGCCGCIAIIGCILGGVAILCLTSDSFKDSFTESYCQSLEDEGIDPSEDPLKLCK